MKNENINNHDETFVRPIFRVLYGILSLIGVAIILLMMHVIYTMWHYDAFKTLELNSSWLFVAGFIFMLGMGTCFAYTGFIIAKSGRAPKYLLKYVNKYKQKENKSV